MSEPWRELLSAELEGTGIQTPVPQDAAGLTEESLRHALDLLANDTEYHPAFLIRPPWMRPHDDGQPRVILCRSDVADVWRATVQACGLAEYYTVTAASDDTVPEGKAIVTRPPKITPPAPEGQQG